MELLLDWYEFKVRQNKTGAKCVFFRSELTTTQPCYLETPPVVKNMSFRGRSPSFFSSGITVWHRASRRKNAWASGFPSFTVSTRLWSWKTNFGSAIWFQEKSTLSVFCKDMRNKKTWSTTVHALCWTVCNHVSHLCYFHPLSREVKELPWMRQKPAKIQQSTVQPLLACQSAAHHMLSH